MEFFEIFPWHKNFETGIELIDEQHKKLVDILNELAAHLANRSHEITLNQVFDDLAAYADYHFKSEEQIWKSHFKGDEWYSSHEQTHGSFIDKLTKLKNAQSEKPLDEVVQGIVSFLTHWLAYHILDSDKRLAMAVHAMEQGSTLEQAKLHANEQMSGLMTTLIETVLSMYDNLSARTMDLMREKSLRKQAEEALLASEERLQAVLESSGDSVWDWDINSPRSHSGKSEWIVIRCTSIRMILLVFVLPCRRISTDKMNSLYTNTASCTPTEAGLGL
jgi:hemerythrin-like metal-binding protein